MSNGKTGFIAILALILSVAALVMCTLCCKKRAASGDAGDVSVVEAALKEKPELAYNAYKAYEKEMIKRRMAPLANEEGFPAVANPDGSIVLLEVFDYSCGYCHRIYPVLKEIAAKNPDVKIIAKPVMFLNQMSVYAAKASLAAGEQGKYGEMYNALFAIEGQLDEEKVDKAAADLGLDMDKYKAAVESDAVMQKLHAFSALAAEADIRGVPTITIDNFPVQASGFEEIQAAIAEARAAK